MAHATAERIAVAGAGIAGLTAALAFAEQGFRVSVFERAPHLEEAGAGLQLSPNATRILRRLGVLDALGAAAVRPEAIVLRSAVTLCALTRLPLGETAERRWRAPYLVAHRADVQKALLARVATEPRITLATGTSVAAANAAGDGIAFSLGDGTQTDACALLVGADGVWSKLRTFLPGAKPARFSGHVAWRAMARMRDVRSAGLADMVGGSDVTALLDPHFHLVAYPVRAGAGVNLVAVTRGRALAQGWTNATDPAPLMAALGRAHPALSRLARLASWSAWPIFTAADGPWTCQDGGIALIGDAAHAMTPFAAQGAAMAIEDAAVLAALAARHRGDMGKALATYDAARRPRVRRVVARGAFNRLVWHAGGPVAFGRDLVLGLRPSRSLLRDFDWLYGHDAEAALAAPG